MAEPTYEKELSITIGELRAFTADILDVLRTFETWHKALPVKGTTP